MTTSQWVSAPSCVAASIRAVPRDFSCADTPCRAGGSCAPAPLAIRPAVAATNRYDRLRRIGLLLLNSSDMILPAQPAEASAKRKQSAGLITRPHAPPDLETHRR